MVYGSCRFDGIATQGLADVIRSRTSWEQRRTDTPPIGGSGGKTADMGFLRLILQGWSTGDDDAVSTVQQVGHDAFRVPTSTKTSDVMLEARRIAEARQTYDDAISVSIEQR